MKERGVRFLEEPRHERYGIVAVFEDLYGNKWDALSLSARSCGRGHRLHLGADSLVVFRR